MGALDGHSHGHHIIELPGDVAQTYVRDPAGNLMEIDTPGASRLPESLRSGCASSTRCSRRTRTTGARGCSCSDYLASSGVTCAAGIGRARWKPCASAQPWRGEELELLGVLDALGDGGQLERLRELHDRGDDRRGAPVARARRAGTSGRS